MTSYNMAHHNGAQEFTDINEQALDMIRGYMESRHPRGYPAYLDMRVVFEELCESLRYGPKPLPVDWAKLDALLAWADPWSRYVDYPISEAARIQGLIPNLARPEVITAVRILAWGEQANNQDKEKPWTEFVRKLQRAAAIVEGDYPRVFYWRDAEFDNPDWVATHVEPRWTPMRPLSRLMRLNEAFREDSDMFKEAMDWPKPDDSSNKDDDEDTSDEETNIDTPDDTSDEEAYSDAREEGRAKDVWRVENSFSVDDGWGPKPGACNDRDDGGWEDCSEKQEQTESEDDESSTPLGWKYPGDDDEGSKNEDAGSDGGDDNVAGNENVNGPDDEEMEHGRHEFEHLHKRMLNLAKDYHKFVASNAAAYDELTDELDEARRKLDSLEDKHLENQRKLHGKIRRRDLKIKELRWELEDLRAQHGACANASS